MAQFGPSGAVEGIHRQLSRLRRRQNLHALQRAVCLLVAIGAAAASVLVYCALAAGAASFALTVWITAGALAGLSLVVVGWAHRGWVPGPRAAAWADGRGGLQGRLTTLAELWSPERTDLLLPLLVEQNQRWLPAWSPRRIVPRRVPWGAVSAAVAALAALRLTLALAPALRPVTPPATSGEETAPVVAGMVPPDASRTVAWPPEGDVGDEPAAGVWPGSGGAGDDRRPALARLPAMLQEALQRAVWGPPSDAARLAAARERRAAGTGPRRGARPDDELEASVSEGQDASGREQDAALRADASGRPGTALGPDARVRADGSMVDGRRERREDDGRAGAGDGAPGAGTGTEPESLFGEPRMAGVEAGDTFELGLSAPVHARRAAPAPPGEAPPPAEPDERPRLAGRERSEAALPKMTVPPAYEAIVRTLFAHRGEGAVVR